MNSKKKTALWGGRFEEKTDQAVQDFTRSVQFDRRLFRQDIRGSKAHSKMLHKIGVLTAAELKSIHDGLDRILSEIEAGKFIWRDDLEDVHMNIESALTERVPAGAKLHTGRSRNDQVATDMRLWIKDQIDSDLKALAELQSALVSIGEASLEIFIPGYTHLQRAQPVQFAHHFLAYVEMLERDAGRLRDACKRADVMPLGSGALAGSTLPLDREFVRKELGFAAVSANSLDAVSDRDFLVEYNSACALIAVHLSRLSEDLILWSSAEFGFVRIGDAFTTGSSLMPQKKNPDIAELVRGKTGRVVGNLMALLTLLKGLPMAYNRDLQEDKERLFDTADTINASLRLTAAMLRNTKIIEDRCQQAVSDPLLLATDVADALVKQGIPFRHAHEIVGRAVAVTAKLGLPLNLLPLSEWQKIDARVLAKSLDVFDVAKSLGNRPMVGAPNPKRVRQELARWKTRLRSRV